MIKIESSDQSAYLKMIEEFSDCGFHFVENYDIWLTLDFRDLTFKGKLVTFKNCIFHEHVYFTNTDLAGGILFEDCTLQRGFTLDKCISGEHSAILTDGSPFSLGFSNCQINHRLVIKSSGLSHDILIHRKCKVDEIEISDTQLTSIRIHDSMIQGPVSIRNLTSATVINLSATNLFKVVLIEKSKADFDFFQCHFHDQLTVSYCEAKLLTIDQTNISENSNFIMAL